MLHFNPLSPHGERPHLAHKCPHNWTFQSTLPAWGETLLMVTCGLRRGISIHSPRMGRDAAHGDVRTPARYFNPLSPHGERLPRTTFIIISSRISIHSPRMGRDSNDMWRNALSRISIHSPRMGRDDLGKWHLRTNFPFQSTLPAWGETRDAIMGGRGAIHFNPLSPHGERPGAKRPASMPSINFNPLSPHGERPPHPIVDWFFPVTFQSTLPAWGETLAAAQAEAQTLKISIHSPRMGRDQPRGAEWRGDTHFNPFSPHGERRPAA